MSAAQKHILLKVRLGNEGVVEWRESLASFLGTEHGRLSGGEMGRSGTEYLGRIRDGYWVK